MSAADYLILALLALAVFFALRAIRRQKKCGGGCGGCPHTDGCARHEKQNKDQAEK